MTQKNEEEQQTSVGEDNKKSAIFQFASSVGNEAVSSESISRDHRRLFEMLKERAVNSLQKSKIEPGLEGLKFIKSATDVATAIVKIERLIWGIDDKSFSCEIDETEQTLEEMDRLTAPPGTS
ncbi:MAG: hypothetical protein V3T30_04785 [Thermodesulfobacteriota bacterium]